MADADLQNANPIDLLMLTPPSDKETDGETKVQTTGACIGQLVALTAALFRIDAATDALNKDK